ncbi:hypothetical protein COB55_00045 [Candidatus Wolfebacteria bacterium]|nr:MAG: hypothetical protein COB55_00045 [Candidatus Wolfebacteria bacterium]
MTKPNIATANGLTRGQESAILIKLTEQMDLSNIQEAGEFFLRSNVKITVAKQTIDLGKSPRLPFDGAEVVTHEGTGVVDIELRSDDNLYLDGKKVELFLSEKQTGDSVVVGNELRKELEGGKKVLLNSNVLDYIYDHPELYPEHWKKDENGYTRYNIFFWGSIFRKKGDLCACYLYWDDGALNRNEHWLKNDWRRKDSSASVSSSAKN